MSRPKKDTVEYFPHEVNHGKTIFVLEETFGNDGYALWFRLLEMLGGTPGHCISIKKPSDWRFFVAKMRVSAEKTQEILDTLADMEAIDKELLKNGYIWSQNFVDNVAQVYDKRKTQIPQKPSILPENPDSLPENPSSSEFLTSETPQSKVKESKVKERVSITKGKDRVKDPSKDLKAPAKPPPPPSVKIFCEITDRDPPRSWYRDIHAVVGEDAGSLELWRKIVKAYVGRGWNPTNVSTMLEYFQKRKIPGNKKKEEIPAGISEKDIKRHTARLAVVCRRKSYDEVRDMILQAARKYGVSMVDRALEKMNYLSNPALKDFWAFVKG